MHGLRRVETPVLTSHILTFDEEGFLPKIDSKLCVDCKRCENACPILNPPQLARTADPTVYACWSVTDVRAQSSSGGMFSVYANHILRGKAPSLESPMTKRIAHFVKVENVDELKKAFRNTSKRTRDDHRTARRTRTYVVLFRAALPDRRALRLSKQRIPNPSPAI